MSGGVNEAHPDAWASSAVEQLLGLGDNEDTAQESSSGESQLPFPCEHNLVPIDKWTKVKTWAVQSCEIKCYLGAYAGKD